MKEEYDLENMYRHQTDDVVQETGDYTCEEGITKKLYEGDKFPSCPQTEIATFWKHAEGHVHKTGEVVPESGTYIDTNGHEMPLVKGDVFLTSPKTGEEIEWRHAEK